MEKEKKYGLFCFFENGNDTEHLDGWDEYGNNKREMIRLANAVGRLECWHDEWSEPAEILIEVWERDASGLWGNSGEPIYRKTFMAGK